MEIPKMRVTGDIGGDVWAEDDHGNVSWRDHYSGKPRWSSCYRYPPASFVVVPPSCGKAVLCGRQLRLWRTMTEVIDPALCVCHHGRTFWLLP